MPKHRKNRRPPKRSLALPDLEPTKSAVLNEPDLKEGPANVRSYFDVQLAA